MHAKLWEKRLSVYSVEGVDLEVSPQRSKIAVVAAIIDDRTHYMHNCIASVSRLCRQMQKL